MPVEMPVEALSEHDTGKTSAYDEAITATATLPG
jgi:hypothetical protein